MFLLLQSDSPNVIWFVPLHPSVAHTEEVNNPRWTLQSGRPTQRNSRGQPVDPVFASLNTSTLTATVNAQESTSFQANHDTRRCFSLTFLFTNAAIPGSGA